MPFLSELRADFVSAKLPRALFVGFLMGAVIVIACIALAAIVFAGPLAPFAAQGAGMVLFGGITFCLLVGLMSGYKGALALPQVAPATVFAAISATVAAGMTHAPVPAPFMTIAALLMLSGVVTGLCFLAIGYFRLANLFRFIPYPVAGGFFAGTGWVVSLAALSVMTGVSPDWRSLRELAWWPVWTASVDSPRASQLDEGRVQHRTGRKRNRDASLCAHARLRATGAGSGAGARRDSAGRVESADTGAPPRAAIHAERGRCNVLRKSAGPGRSASR